MRFILGLLIVSGLTINTSNGMGLGGLGRSFGKVVGLVAGPGGKHGAADTHEHRPPHHHRHNAEKAHHGAAVASEEESDHEDAPSDDDAPPPTDVHAHGNITHGGRGFWGPMGRPPPTGRRAEQSGGRPGQCIRLFGTCSEACDLQKGLYNARKTPCDSSDLVCCFKKPKCIRPKQYPNQKCYDGNACPAGNFLKLGAGSSVSNANRGYVDCQDNQVCCRELPQKQG